MTTRDELRVCKRCGWYDSYGHETECSPKGAAAADRLVKHVREHVDVKATKLGYGHGRLTFQLSKTCSLTLDVQRNGKFHVDGGLGGLFWLDDLDDDEVTKLVCVLYVMVEQKRKEKQR